MLYQTHHHPFLFSFIFILSLLPLPSFHNLKMECVEAALKSSFRKDMALKLTPQTFNVQNVTTCDDFVVDDLLDFSHQEEAIFEEEEEEPKHKQVSVSEKQNQTHEIFNNPYDHFPSLPTSELSVPDDEAANLEWLSHFVEDSFSEHSVFSAAGASPASHHAVKAAEPVRPCFRTPVPAKARSKRTRTGVRVWPVVSPSSTSSSTTATPCSPSLSSPSSPLLVCAAASVDRGFFPPEKKVKVRVATEAAPPRRCSHCGVQKTPQWRTGPLGAKTLCNACGVRFKSGRLLPEYRPACSPTFSSELHSNHHRKVVEMRRKKEVVGEPEPFSGLASPPVDPGF